MVVRAKFAVSSKQVNEDGSGTVRLNPVVDGSDENKSFYKYTPGGEITLSTINPAAIAAFDEGAEFYVDFTPPGEDVDPALAAGVQTGNVAAGEPTTIAVTNVAAKPLVEVAKPKSAREHDEGVPPHVDPNGND